MQNRNKGCCPSVHAKTFEIILIIGFILSIILLIVNLVLSLWCFKYSYALFIIEIGLIALNFISIILSIILRVWRSDGSVHNKNFSSSNSVAIFNIVLVIINLLASIAEEVLFSFVISFLSLYLDFRKYNAAVDEAREALENYFNNGSEPIPEMMIPDMPDFDYDEMAIDGVSPINYEQFEKKEKKYSKKL